MAPGNRAGTRAVTTDWDLSRLEYDAVCTWLGIGEMPYPVDIPRHGETMTARERLLDEARDSLSADGMVRSGEVAPGMTNVLRGVADAKAWVDLIAFNDGPIRAVAARTGHDTVIVADDGARIRLRSVADTTMPVALLALLPETAAAPRQGVTVPLAALNAVAARQPSDETSENALQQGDFAALTRQGVPAEDARLLLKYANGRIRGGQFGVHAKRHGDDRPRRDERTLSFYDNPLGRYLVVNDGGWVSIAPADNGRIARRIDEVLHAEGSPGPDDPLLGAAGDIPLPIW